MLDDFYKEIRPNSSSQCLKSSSMNEGKKDDYNALRNELIKKFEANLNAYSEEYARKKFGMSRKVMFARIKINDLLWGLSSKDNVWHIFTHDEYKKALQGKELDENVSIFNFE